MPEQDKPFVINDRRRRFQTEGDPTASAPEIPVPEPAAAVAPAAETMPASGPVPVTNSAHLVTPVPEAANEPAEVVGDLSENEDLADAQRELPPPPTPEEIEQVRAAYEVTSERLDTVMRSQNLGAEHLPPMDFKRLVQSVYMSAMIQLGAGTQQGQPARVDLIGAKQSIEMLTVIGEKTSGNLSPEETTLLASALFELRMGFLEITQLLARQAAAKQTAPSPGATGQAPKFGASPASSFTGAGPRIVR